MKTTIQFVFKCYAFIVMRLLNNNDSIILSHSNTLEIHMIVWMRDRKWARDLVGGWELWLMTLLGMALNVIIVLLGNSIHVAAIHRNVIQQEVMSVTIKRWRFWIYQNEILRKFNRMKWHCMTGRDLTSPGFLLLNVNRCLSYKWHEKNLDFASK